MSSIDTIVRSNPDYVLALHQQWLGDPASVEPHWQAFFAGYELGGEDARAEQGVEPAAIVTPTTAGAPIFLTERGAIPEGAPAEGAALRIYDLVHAHRMHGHLIANLDPLGRSPRTHPYLDTSEFGFSESDLDQAVSCPTFKGLTQGTVREFMQALRETYCGPIGVEFLDVSDRDERDWLTERMEPVRNRPRLTPEERRAVLVDLLAADGFEEWLARAYPTAKRFSLEGATTLVTLLKQVIDVGAELGVEQAVMGMAHRGRLNVLANVLGKPLEFILAEFEGRPFPAAIEGYGDVKYHLGHSREHVTPTGKTVLLSLEFNPSHLEVVDPVVEGIVRARQNIAGDKERSRVIPLLMHGDAAFVGQGIVAETLMLSGLEAYRTGGTVHVIVNNQVGFTTTPEEGRSTRYATDLAKFVKAPVFHVNADHPEAVLLVASLAIGFRQRFQRDVVVDLTCYRRYGHNELDDASFTQPVMAKLIKAHPSNSRIYADRLVLDGKVAAEEVEAMREGVRQAMEAAREKAKAMPAQHVEELDGAWKDLHPAGKDWSARTEVPRETLERIARAIVTVPEGFNWHPRLEKLMQQRADMVLKDEPMDWGCAEALAFGSLLVEGTKVRLTGQDTQRGTFSHRHAVYHDHENGTSHVPLNHVAPDQNVFQVYNSPLSEAAVLGFEHGYSTADPWTLVCWEAQFGDFVNGAQVVIDQLLASCEYKWGRMSGLVLLLPHGYEGQGPEHSSARLERFLELCAENNLQVCNFTTPAQYFHAMRRQVKRQFRKPLIVMTPKSLLRHPAAVSRVVDFTDGSFQTLIPDATVREPGGVRRALLCSGKIAYALRERREERGASDVAIITIEQLYPFPLDLLKGTLAACPRLERVVWVQEEPRNMGAWRNLRHQLERSVPAGVRLEYAGRDSRAVPATGSHETHVREEAALVDAAFSDLPVVERVVRRDVQRGGKK